MHWNLLGIFRSINCYYYYSDYICDYYYCCMCRYLWISKSKINNKGISERLCCLYYIFFLCDKENIAIKMEAIVDLLIKTNPLLYQYQLICSHKETLFKLSIKSFSNILLIYPINTSINHTVLVTEMGITAWLIEVLLLLILFF